MVQISNTLLVIEGVVALLLIAAAFAFMRGRDLYLHAQTKAPSGPAVTPPVEQSPGPAPDPDGESTRKAATNPAPSEG